MSDSQPVKLCLHVVEQAQPLGGAAVMDEHVRAAELTDKQARFFLRAAPEENLGGRVVFKINHIGIPVQLSLEKGVPHSGQNRGVSPGSGV